VLPPPLAQRYGIGREVIFVDPRPDFRLEQQVDGVATYREIGTPAWDSHLYRGRYGAIWRDLTTAYFGNEGSENPRVAKKLTEMHGESVFFFAAQDGEMRPPCPGAHLKFPPKYLCSAFCLLPTAYC
jgi:hypothetical protein